VRLAAIIAAIEAQGLAFRGALHTEAEDEAFVGEGARTLVLAGFVGHDQWDAFSASPEACDGAPDPLDRWSRRVIEALAHALGGSAVFPFGGPPWAPFLRWAQRAEPLHASPIGLLIHPDFGLWHAWRGAISFRDRLDLPEPEVRASPCETCADKPCLRSCPVSAFAQARYDIDACMRHTHAPAGAPCVEAGCAARLACPVGAAYRYRPAQARFHMQAFHKARR